MNRMHGLTAAASSGEERTMHARRGPFPSSVLIIAVCAAVVPSSPQAASFERLDTFKQFDKMDLYDQAELVAAMIDTAQTALRNAGKGDLANQIEELFTQMGPNDSGSYGFSRFVDNLYQARLADMKAQAENPNSARVSMEWALFWTLEQNNIKLTVPEMNEVWDPMREFHPQTYAEFHAKPLAEQRRAIKVYAEFAFPAYTELDYAKSQRKTLLGLDGAAVRELWNFLKTQFPLSGAQPGFAEVTKQIEAVGMKTPDQAGPSRQLISYVQYQVLKNKLDEERRRNEEVVRELEDRDRELTRRTTEMDDRAVMMPDGRHVFPDRGGNLWYLANGKSYKLEGPDKVLAQKLLDCKEARHIDNGEQALEACREQVGLGKGIGPARR
jgi:hypothetical protein